MKKTFILYAEHYEIFKELQSGEAGLLIKAIFEYSILEKDPELPNLLKILFNLIKKQLDEDKEKWLKKVETNRANANARWGNKNATVCDRMPPHTNECGGSFSHTKRQKAMPNDYASSYASSYDKESFSKKGYKFLKPTLEQIKKHDKEKEFNLKNKGEDFFEYYNSNDWIDSNGKPVKNWRQRMLAWSKDESNLNKKKILKKLEMPKDCEFYKTEIGRAVAKVIEISLGVNIFIDWFAKHRAENKEGLISIIYKNEFSANYVTTSLSGTLGRALKDIFGKDYKGLKIIHEKNT